MIIGDLFILSFQGPVTSVSFMSSQENVVVSSSKDTFVKFWDLQTQHCFKTLTGHLTEVWDFALINNDTNIVTGCSDAELRVWSLVFKEDVQKCTAGVVLEEQPDTKKERLEDNKDVNDSKDFANDDSSILEIRKLGSILRSGQDKLQRLSCDKNGRILTCHGSDN